MNPGPYNPVELAELGVEELDAFRPGAIVREDFVAQSRRIYRDAPELLEALGIERLPDAPLIAPEDRETIEHPDPARRGTIAARAPMRATRIDRPRPGLILPPSVDLE